MKQKLLTALIVLAALMFIPASASAADCEKDDYYGCGTAIGDFLHWIFGSSNVSVATTLGVGIEAENASGNAHEVTWHSNNLPSGLSFRVGARHFDASINDGEIAIGSMPEDCISASDPDSPSPEQCTSNDTSLHVDVGYEREFDGVTGTLFVRYRKSFDGGHDSWGVGAEAHKSAGTLRLVYEQGEVFENEHLNAAFSDGHFKVLYGFRF